MKRFTLIAPLALTALALAGCSKSTPEEAPVDNGAVVGEPDANDMVPLNDTLPSAAPAPTPTPSASPTPTDKEDASAQMQDDADATGMTARVSRSDGDAANESQPADASEKK